MMKKNKALGLLLKDRNFLIGAVIIVITLFITIFAQQIVPYNPGKVAPHDRLMPPFWSSDTNAFHFLGTDSVGRDLLSRIFIGIKNSMVIGIFSIAVAILIGAVVGLLSGLSYPGFIDSLLMRITDIQMGFPFVLLAIIILSLVDPTVVTIILVLSLSAWPAYARVIRSGVIIEKEMDYVAAAKIMGASRLRIAFKYLGKNLVPAILPVAPMDLASIVIAESLLSFMNLGIQPPGISLGNIMADGWKYIATQWWITASPGIVIFIIVLGLNLMADAMQAVSGKRQKE
ncbi:MAG: peptide ABC transporter permease [Anaerolineales bacterium]|nr:MAG: peptide ABC transporter permease [Anaerolineales bacterium]